MAEPGRLDGVVIDRVMPCWIHLVLDVPRPRWKESVEFWAAVTTWSASVESRDMGRFTTLSPPSGDAWLRVQAIDGPPRIHLDLDSADPTAAAARALELGALPAGHHRDATVTRSPGGLLTRHTHDPHRAGWFARTDTRAVVDQVCIDIPATRWQTEVAFWQALTGRELEGSRRPEFTFLGSPDPHGGIRILLQRLDTGDGEVGAHLDVAVEDRGGETARHLDLGAEVITVMERWTVLRAPDGHRYCLTDRDPRTGNIRV